MKTLTNALRFIANHRFQLLLIGLLFFLYFFRSFVLYVDLINPVMMEECHTGAVVREVLKHGFQFPLEQYTPEYYENSILVGSLLTLAPASVLGVSRLSLEITPFVLSFLTLLIFMSLLMRGGYGNGMWFFVISFFFASEVFVYISMESVVGHNLGLFHGALILHRFYTWHTSRDKRCFYQVMFLVGLGLFVHLGSLLYAALCALVFLLYRPAHGARPWPTAAVILRGALYFVLGALPFIIFLFKTNLQNAAYLFSVVGRRNTGVTDWGTYARNAWDQLLFQFNDKPWLAMFYFAMVFLAWLAWRGLRGKDIPESKRLLHFIICLFPAPVLLAVVVFSGGEFTTYYAYLTPLLFLAGAAVFSPLFDRLKSSRGPWRALLLLLPVALVAMLVFNANFKYLNFSIGHAMRKLTVNEDLAFCYWRFGRSFGNYVFYEGDSGKYASEILNACGRFDSLEKRNECLWGWSTISDNSDNVEFTLDAQAVETLGPEASRIIARSIGGWAHSLNQCLIIQKEYVDDCILGMVERRAVIQYSIKHPAKPYVRIPCQAPETTRFSGLVQQILDRLRQPGGTAGDNTCPENMQMLCDMAEAYCAAVEKRMDFCDTSYDSPDDKNLCKFIFQQVWLARQTD